jgi:hypothetical protein
VLFQLIGNTVFLRLSDVARDLPTYSERVVVCPLDGGSESEVPSQASSYERLVRDLRQATLAALAAGSKRLLAAYLQALLAYPDACTRGETVLDPTTGSVIAEVPALPDDALYPKERALVDLALRERGRGRRLLVYISHTERRDISPRLRTILEQAGLTVAILKSGTVAADRREEWLASRVHDGAEVLICHPRLVQTGLDLIDWPSICWYETEYSVYVMRQASRRSWRIGQRQPVEITFMVYEGTIQAEALALVAAKMRSALMIEGELPSDGLAALERDGQDVLLALARQMTDKSTCHVESLESLFTRRQEAGSAADDWLVDSDWGSASLLPWTGNGGHGAKQSERTGTESVASAPVGAAPRTISFDELARLLRPSKPRRKKTQGGQMALFAE